MAVGSASQSVALLQEANKPHLKATHAHPTSSMGAAGVSKLKLQDKEIAELNKRDLHLYSMLRSAFKERVRKVEEQTGVSLLASCHRPNLKLTSGAAAARKSDVLLAKLQLQQAASAQLDSEVAELMRASDLLD